MKVLKYEEKYKKSWNSFVEFSKNATFLFDRDFMEYHAERFEDCSLVVFNERGVLVALLPASVKDGVVTSHAGLTYGGVLVGNSISTEKVIQIFSAILIYLKASNNSKFVYKAIPHIYHNIPSEEDLYALFKHGFGLIKRDVSSSFNLDYMRVKGKKINSYKKALEHGFDLKEVSNADNVLDIVNVNLKLRYGVEAIHKSEEINLLKKSFKKNVVIYELLLENKVCGGAILFVDNGCVHAQYIATNEEAKKFRGLDYIIVALIDMYKHTARWFDYGISTEQGGHFLNVNLIKSKEGFNMAAVCYDTYELIF